MKEIYYVYNKQNSKPKYQHECFENALDEAQRIARIEQTEIEVLKVIAVVKPVTTYDITYYSGVAK
jgi:chromosome segregation and condensation protein ScpB